MGFAARHGLGLSLLVVYAILWTLLGIDPLSRSDWVLENLLVWGTLPPLIVWRRRLGVTRLSEVLLFVFYTLHAIGGHWSYSSVPLPWHEWGFERNHYDRIVHFSFGALLWLPIRDALRALAPIPRVLAELFALSLTLSLSALYEIIEWGAVAVVAPDLGQAFLGAQGDEFDATKDMALAVVGAFVAWGISRLPFGLRAASAPSPMRALSVRNMMAGRPVTPTPRGPAATAPLGRQKTASAPKGPGPK